MRIVLKTFFLIALFSKIIACDFAPQDQGRVMDQGEASSEEEIVQFIRELFQKSPEPIDESLIRDDI